MPYSPILLSLIKLAYFLSVIETIIISGIVKPLFRFNVVFLFLVIIFGILPYTNPSLFILFSMQFLLVVLVVVLLLQTNPFLFYFLGNFIVCLFVCLFG